MESPPSRGFRASRSVPTDHRDPDGKASDQNRDDGTLTFATLTFGTLIFAPYVFAGMVVADYAQGKLDNGDEDSSVCANYEKDLIKAREKGAGGRRGEKKAEKQAEQQAEKQDRRSKRILPLWDEEY